VHDLQKITNMLNFFNLLVLLFLAFLTNNHQVDCNVLVSSKITEFKAKYNPKSQTELVNILLNIKELEKQMIAEETERLRKLEEKRNKIFKENLVSRVKGASVLRDFYSGRY
jgi:hypothetical protein